MELSLLLGEQIFILFFMSVIGYAIVKIKLLKASDSKVLSLLIIYVCSPCALLNAFQIPYSRSKMSGFGLALAVAFIIQVFFIILVKVLGEIWKFNGIEKASIIYTNSGYLVIPIVMGVMGEEWVFYASAYLITFNIFLWTHGIRLICKNEKMNIKKIITNPNLLASILGVLFFVIQFEFPAAIGGTVAGLGKLVGPVSMIAIGMLVGGIDLKKAFVNKKIYIICFIRLIVLPLCMIGAIKLHGTAALHMEGKEILRITLFAVSAPVAAAVTQIAQVYGEDAEYAGLINTTSILLCTITMPLMVLIYEMVI